ncbi:MAG: hypothetical protein ACAI35_15005 [Candidatus Methylacidiphilales bacterium]|nr:hypothetical protein [Candidatus Methylacidiphilales bacterium]
MKVRTYKVTRVTPVPSTLSEQIEITPAEPVMETSETETETGGRGWRSRVSCCWCGRVNRVWVSRYSYYYYSCWYCGNTFCV